jgi:hypothetical protein
MQFTNENDMKVEVEELKDRSSRRDLFFFLYGSKEHVLCLFNLFMYCRVFSGIILNSDCTRNFHCFPIPVSVLRKLLYFHFYSNKMRFKKMF